MARTIPYADCADEELLSLVRQGTGEAFGALVRRYEGELFGYLCRYLGDRDLADDVFQNTFLQIYSRIEQYQAGRPVRPWLYAIGTNQAIDAMRRQRRHRNALALGEGSEFADGDAVSASAFLETGEATPLDQLHQRERQQMVRSSVDRLPEFLKQVVILAYYQGLKYAEIAVILEIPLGTVKSRLHTAMSRLSEEWANEPALSEALD